MTNINEDRIEQEAMEILRELGFETLFGPDISAENGDTNNPQIERQYTDMALRGRIERAVAKINPNIPAEAQAQAVAKTIRNFAPDIIANNRQFHKLLVDGVDVNFRDASGEIKDGKVWLVDFVNPANNEFLAINQFSVIQGENKRRPDVVLFINGLPLGILELKNPVIEGATLQNAYNQLQTYKSEIPDLFRFNELLIISDGVDAEVGTLTADFERFVPWKTIDDEDIAGVPMLEVMLRGMCNKSHLLEIIRHFITFERKDDSHIKKLAAYHQFRVVQKAIAKTNSIIANEEQKIGVVWHTQGSGKSLSMVFFAGKAMMDPQLSNPTIVVITDRQDLDDQLLETFTLNKDLLRETPKQATSRLELRELLRRDSGGIIFTTIQKFFAGEDGDTMPILTDRKNVIVMADEAHRSQYGFSARIKTDESGKVRTTYGNAKYMREALPNAKFIGFTGTPIERTDRSTPAVFGEYIDVYDIEQAVKDGATVPIYYESRLINLDIDEEMRSQIDGAFEELVAGEELTKQEEWKAKGAQLEAIVGNSRRVKRMAEDLIEHFESRLEAADGKGMIVVLSRRIAVDLYNAIIEIRPHWHSDKDDEGFVKVVMTGSATDPLEWQRHIRTKERRRALADYVKNPNSSIKLVIVCDMWLTGFDAPSMHTMYLDKPLKSYMLMQAIARVNRVYPNKEGGLGVDYLGVAGASRDALSDYTESGGKGKPVLKQDEAVLVMKEKFEILEQMFSGFTYREFGELTTKEQMQMLLDAQEFVLGLEDGEKRFSQHILELGKAFSLAIPHEDALAIREKVAFYQAVKARLGKLTEKGKSSADYAAAIRQIVDKAIAPAGIVDIFEAAGINKPNLSVLSDEFLAEIRGMKRKNLAVEALNRLLNDEVKARFSTNAVKRQSFEKMLEEALKRYRNKTVEAAKVIEELIEIGKQIGDASDEAEKLGLSSDEVAFYDALVAHGNAKDVMGDDQLRELARLLVERVRSNTGVDWTVREAVQARLRVEVRRLLRQYGYPPDQEKMATDLVLKQATLFAEDWS